ncbi:MAG: hypothetical protein MJA30_01585, partial [Cytophagales bacterium]|nr:hypothetical protein [Cytophagales bacterium]
SYITYLYDATGIKLAQAVYNTSHELIKKTEYVGEFIYESEGTPSTELAFIHHDEGRIVPNPVGDGYDYEYYLKDHLGNTRVTFTTKPKTHTFYTNYEDTSDDDQALFEDVTTVSNDIFDHTDQLGTTYTHAQLLNGTEGSRIGSVIAIPVGMGDTLNAKVYAKYVEMTTDLTNAVTSLATSLVNAFTGGIGGTNELGNQSINNNFGSGSLIGTNGFQADNTAPMAFLSVMFLPEGETIDLEKDVSFAYDQISSTASQPIGQPKNTNYDELRIDNLVAPAPGYMLVYLSNESSTIAEVYFDDLTIEVKEDPVIQTDDYYPFGLTFNSYQRVTAKENRYLYNQGIGDIQFKTERITDLDLNLDMTKYRMYDYATGRFTQVDPLADANPQESLTPYQYSFNNPIRYNDPNGDCPPWLCGAVIGAAVDYGLQVGVNIAQGKSLGDALTEVDGRSILVSAAAGAVSGGISSISKLKNASKLIRAATEITVDAGASAANQLTTTGKIDGTDLLIDVAAAQTVGKIVKNKVDANAKSSPEGKVLSEAADRKQRIANNRQEISKNGGRTRPNQQNKANQAKQRFDSHGASRAVASGTASSGAVSTTLKQASQQSSGGGGREIEHNKLNYPTGILGRGN